MPYSWDDVALNISISKEKESERKDYRKIEKKKQKEEDWMAAGSLGASVLCSVLGPGWSLLCKKAAEWGIDAMFDWESMDVPEGKYDPATSREVNKELESIAKAQTWGQIIDTATDLGSMWMQAGGPAAYKAGEMPDLTTYGHGPGEWSVRGTPGTPGDPFTDPSWSVEGAGGMLDPVTGKAIGTAPMPVGTPGDPGVPALWNPLEGNLANLWNVGGRMMNIAGGGAVKEVASEASCLAIDGQWIDGKCFTEYDA